MRLASRCVHKVALLVVCGLTLGACEGSSNDLEENALGRPMRVATCADWKPADPRSRRAALEELRGLRNDQISGQGVGRGYGSVLDDDVAYRLLDSRCSLPNSETFQLYKMYSFAAGFAGKAP